MKKERLPRKTWKEKTDYKGDPILNTKRVIKCSNGHWDLFLLYRTNETTKKTQVREIDTKVSPTILGKKPYSSGWKSPGQPALDKLIVKLEGLRCRMCKRELKAKDLEGISEIKIEEDYVFFISGTEWF